MSSSTDQTLYFYDLETSGFNARTDRIMQFAGQRTSLDLKPLGEPDNFLIQLTDDVLPSPDAILVTGITPQKTKAEGYTEAEFLRLFHETVAVSGTIFAGYNTIRFDDEFMRFLHWRNFYDAYEWQWKDGRGRWDLLDVVRMTRALRPEGIKWPFDTNGKPTNKLEFLSAVNKLDHTDAHDALSDVKATVALAQLLYAKQPKLFEYLRDMRDKKKIAHMAEKGQPFVYASGKYPSEFEKTTVVVTIGQHPKKQGVLVYDLRHDPEPFLKMSPQELAEAWKWKKESSEPRVPVKTLQFNRCPAVAPLGVLDEASQKRLSISLKTIEENRKKLVDNTRVFVEKLYKALAILDKAQQTRLIEDEISVDAQLYDSFVGDADRQVMEKVRNAKPEDLSLEQYGFSDARLKNLFPLYKARNFPKKLTDEERAAWEAFRTQRLSAQLPAYIARLQELTELVTGESKRYLLEELRLYAEGIAPVLD